MKIYALEKDNYTGKINTKPITHYDFFARHHDGNLEAEEVFDLDYGTQAPQAAQFINDALDGGDTVDTLNDSLERVQIVGVLYN